MLFGLLIIGLLLIASALKNTQHELGDQLQRDLLGKDGFLAWAGAILAIGALGYLPGMRTTSRYLLALLGVVMVVRNGGIFGNVKNAISAASALGPAPAIPAPAVTKSSDSSSGGSGSGSSSSGGSSSSSSSGGTDYSQYAQYAEYAALLLA